MGYDFFGVFERAHLSYNHYNTLHKAIKPTKCRIKLKKKGTRPSSRCTGIRALYGLKGRPLQSELDKATKKIEKMNNFTYLPKMKYEHPCWSEDFYDKKNVFGVYRELKYIKEISKRNPSSYFHGD